MAAENALVDHLMEHDNELEPDASLLPSFGSEQVAPSPGKRGRRTRASQSIAPAAADRRTRFAAAYDEAIAIAVRRVAPLGTFAITRRCLLNYTTGLGDIIAGDSPS